MCFRKKFFTLIELVMVIVIIGIMAAIAVPKFINMRSDAENAAAQGTIAALRSVAYIYYAQSATNTYLCHACSGEPAQEQYPDGSGPYSCNSNRTVDYVNPDDGSDYPCFPCDVAELNQLLAATSGWVLSSGTCYDSSNGSFYDCL
ncbi:MAG: type II secretion system protein [Candidatus Omnitrophica bacterium]|nr:type II secretion system protein [Candidatus Omnitrophota bacterium]